jgi:hypothetical protein
MNSPTLRSISHLRNQKLLHAYTEDVLRGLESQLWL